MRKRSVSEVRALADRAGAARSSYPPSAHQVNEYLNLAAQFGADPRPIVPHLAISGPELDEARNVLLQMIGKMAPGATREPVFLGMNPGAEYGPAKRWPAANFAAAAREISLLAPDAIWLLFGGRGDVEICAEVAQNAPAKVLNLAGRTSLRELCQYLKLCRLLLTNDTGPMHIAAALGTPVVVPFGSTSPELTGPGLPGDPSHRLILSGAACAPCFLRACPIDFRCMQQIGVERVARAAAEILRRR
jgi:heptosyltransferase-2